MLSAVAVQGGQRRSTMTDEEGNFRFTDLSPRPYNILVVASREYVQPPAITGSGERRYYRPGENVYIALIRGGVITGRVTKRGWRAGDRHTSGRHSRARRRRTADAECRADRRSG